MRASPSEAQNLAEPQQEERVPPRFGDQRGHYSQKYQAYKSGPVLERQMRTG